MCYSGRCLWEDHMSNCIYPTYILGNKISNCNFQDRKYKISKIKKKMSKMDFLDNSL